MKNFIYKILSSIFIKTAFWICIIILAAALNFQDNVSGWVQQNPPIESGRIISDIQFLDSNTGWMIANPGSSGIDTVFILKTTNGGTNWFRQSGIYHTGLNAIFMVDMNTGYTAGGTGSGVILKTTNGGDNWFSPVSWAADDFADIEFINKDTGWAAGGFAGVIRTTNGGNNWTQQNPRGASRIQFINNNTGYFTSASNLLKTTNSGVNWNIIRIFSSNLNSLFFVNKDTGWATGGGLGTGLIKTTDGGFNWTAVQNPGATTEGKLFFINSKRGWLGSGFTKILATTDGWNWGIQIPPISDNYYVTFVDSLKGWAGYGGLIHTTDGGGQITYTGINSLGNETADIYKLNQNYPNPFNPETKISYELSQSGHVKLEVNDIQGKLIETIVDKNQQAGAYEVNFSGRNLTSGVYFYIIDFDRGRDRFIDTKKMMLIK